MIPRKIVPIIYVASTILQKLFIPESESFHVPLYLIYTILMYTVTVAVADLCLELIRYIHRILKVNEVKRCRNELLIGYMAVILWAMRSRYSLYYSGYDEETVFWLQLNALIYACSINSFLCTTLHANPRFPTPRYSEFTETQASIAAAHYYIILTALGTGNWLQVFAWILSLASSMHIYEILTSQRPEPAPVAPATITNIRDRPEARAEARAEMPDNQEEQGNLGAGIQATPNIQDRHDERERMIRGVMRDLARKRAAAPATKPEATENSTVPPTTGARQQTGSSTAVPYRQYLDSTVLPILQQGLEFLAKCPTQYPIEVLADFLLLKKDCYNAENQNPTGLSMDPAVSPHCNEAMVREEENLGARIQAAWYPMGNGGYSLRADNQRYFDLLIGRFKTIADPFKIRDSANKMEEKRRHRDQRNELLGLPNAWKDDDFFDDLEDVTGITGYSNLSGLQ
ncbi:hypothetical protein CRE_10603 [Caenorhabditis remanei]|uniref:Uncharacterized protein n=1 Tax=Caenorhabditis remanei TaxID=31234 RepID=E3NBL9_CAERE|nr:hypothetical protein CRE_10603 [Caenorhabditis remanei]